MREKRRLTSLDFETLKPLITGISDDRKEAARLALVEGLTLQAVSQRYGWSRQAVGDAVNVVWREHDRYQQSQRVANAAGVLLPPGWEQVTLIAPSHLIAQFRAAIAKVAHVESHTASTSKPMPD